MQHLVHVRLIVRTALALQHLAHVRLAVRASNHIDIPLVNPTHCQNRDIDLPTSTISYPQRSSSCTSTTRPTSATRNDRPAAYNDSTDISYPQRTSSCISTTRLTSATRNNRPTALLRLDQHQLLAPNVQLHLSTTRPTSATRIKHLAVPLRLDHTSVEKGKNFVFWFGAQFNSTLNQDDLSYSARTFISG